MFLFGDGSSTEHWIQEKAKIYGKYKDGFPDKVDEIKVEYAKPEYGWLDTTFFLNGGKMITIPLSDICDPLENMIKWLEKIIDGDFELNDHYLYLDCEGNHAILHYEKLQEINQEIGLFYVYGSWTNNKKTNDKTLAAICYKRDIVEALYIPLIALWEDLAKHEAEHPAEDIHYHWNLPYGDLESPKEMFNLIRSIKIESFITDDK